MRRNFDQAQIDQLITSSLSPSHPLVLYSWGLVARRETLNMRAVLLCLLLILVPCQLGSAFVPSNCWTQIARNGAGRASVNQAAEPLPAFTTTLTRNDGLDRRLHSPFKNQRRSVAVTQMMGLFGLGPLEIVIILVGIGVVLGPEKLVEMVRSSGDTAKEYKKELSKVPDEFKKGLEEGEMEARARKAKPMKKVGSKIDNEE